MLASRPELSPWHIHDTPLTARGLLRHAAGPYLAAVGMVPVGLVARRVLDGYSPWIQLPASVGICAVIYLALGYQLFGLRETILTVQRALLARRS